MSATVTDSAGAVWTFDASHATLQNGVAVGGGSGTDYALVNGVAWVLGMDNPPVWYAWNGSGWVSQGGATPTMPSPTGSPAPSPSPAPAPSPTPPLTVYPLQGNMVGGYSNRTQIALGLLLATCNSATPPTNSDAAYALADDFIAKSSAPPK